MESIKTWIGADGVEECHCLAIDEVEVIKHGETDCDIVGGLYRSRSFYNYSSSYSLEARFLSYGGIEVLENLLQSRWMSQITLFISS